MMQAPAYCSYCYYVGSLHIGSLHPLGIWLRDLCVMCPPQLQFMLVMPSVVNAAVLTHGLTWQCATAVGKLFIY